MAWRRPGMLEYCPLTLRNKLQWNFDRNSYILIDEIAFENVVRKMSAICFGFNVLN